MTNTTTKTNNTVNLESLITSVEVSGIRKTYHIGDNFIVEVSTSKNDHSRHSLAKHWKKHGYTTKEFETWLNVSTYYYDEKGNCYGYYNPTVKIQIGKNFCHPVIDFDYLLEATPENEKYLVCECIKAMLRDEKRKIEEVK
jgi:hypothetical protein